MKVKYIIETEENIEIPIGENFNIIFDGRSLNFKIIGINKQKSEEKLYRDFSTNIVLEDKELQDESDLYSLKDGKSIYE